MAEHKRYSGRQDGVVVKALSLDRYACELLAELAPTPKSYGAFLSGLIYAEAARREERQPHVQGIADAAPREG